MGIIVWALVVWILVYVLVLRKELAVFETGCADAFAWSGLTIGRNFFFSIFVKKVSFVEKGQTLLNSLDF